MGASAAAPQRVCANLIVRDEERVIARGLRSVAPLVTAVYVTDTGSVDNTVQVVHDVCAELGLEVHVAHDEWTDDFGRNRQQALDRVPRDACTHVLFMDADETWEYAAGWQWPAFQHDVYMVHTRNRDLYKRPLLVAHHGQWEWRGVRHESHVWVPHTGRAPVRDTIEGLTNVPHQDSARAHDPLRFHKDAVALRREHVRDPTDSRTVFYLARSLEAIGDVAGATTFYALRVAMPGFDEERMEAQIALARMWRDHFPEKSQKEVDGAFLKAYWLAPFRTEPILALVQRMRLRGDHFQAYLLASMAILRLKTDPTVNEHGVPQDATLFTQQWQYGYGLETEVALGAASMGDWDHAERTAERLTKTPLLDPASGDGLIMQGNLDYMRHARWQDHSKETEHNRARMNERFL